MSPDPDELRAAADLREQIADTLAQVFTDTGTSNIWTQADALLTGPLWGLVEQAAEAREWHDTAWAIKDEHTAVCAERDALAAEAARLRGTVARVEALHRHVEADEPGCDDFCGYDSEDWPCATRRALDGDDG